MNLYPVLWPPLQTPAKSLNPKPSNPNQTLNLRVYDFSGLSSTLTSESRSLLASLPWLAPAAARERIDAVAAAAADAGEPSAEVSEDMRVRAAILLMVLAPPLVVSMENPGAFFGVLQVIVGFELRVWLVPETRLVPLGPCLQGVKMVCA